MVVTVVADDVLLLEGGIINDLATLVIDGMTPVGHQNLTRTIPAPTWLLLLSAIAEEHYRSSSSTWQ
jgi:hypothetical protein